MGKKISCKSNLILDIGDKDGADAISRRAESQRSCMQPDSCSFEKLLESIDIGDTIVAEYTNQVGTVEEIIRDRYGLPVCAKVAYLLHGDAGNIITRGYDYIAMADVTGFYDQLGGAVKDYD